MHRLLLLFACFVTASGGSITLDSVRITALSETLLRVEPKGPLGFEDRNTFAAANRSAFGAGVNIQVLNTTADPPGTWLATANLHVFIPAGGSQLRTCGSNSTGDSLPPKIRSKFYPAGAIASSAQACCGLCLNASDCRSWVFNPGLRNRTNCYPMKSASGPDTNVSNRVYGQIAAHGILVAQKSNGEVIWPQPGTNDEELTNILHWPSPLSKKAYAVTDYPRFTVPAWGPTPMSKSERARLDPALVPTNGYDFRNNVANDAYIFVLGNDLGGWWHARAEFLQLTGPTPVLPDWAYGSWYTWCCMYTEDSGKEDVRNWTSGKYPLDVWALDMEWRRADINTSKDLPPEQSCRSMVDPSPLCPDHFYNAPNTDKFPGLGGPNHTQSEWFQWLHSAGLKTYFNDHPFPQAKAATPEEVQFRYDGLSMWLDRGLDFWWYDHVSGLTRHRQVHTISHFFYPPPELGLHSTGTAPRSTDQRRLARSHRAGLG